MIQLKTKLYNLIKTYLEAVGTVLFDERYHENSCKLTKVIMMEMINHRRKDL